MSNSILNDLSAGFYVIHMNDRLPPRTARALRDVIQIVDELAGGGKRTSQIVLFSWIFLHRLGELSDQTEPAAVMDSWMDEWRLGRLFSEFLRETGIPGEGAIQEQLGWLRQLIACCDIPEQWDAKIISAWVQDQFNSPQAARLLNLNQYKGVGWFSKEGFEKFCGWLETLLALNRYADKILSAAEGCETLLKNHQIFERLKQTAQKAGYEAEKFFSLLAKSTE